MCWGSCASKGGKEESWLVFDRETRRVVVDFENSIRVRVYFERRKQPTGKCCVISFPVPSLVIIVLKWIIIFPSTKGFFPGIASKYQDNASCP